MTEVIKLVTTEEKKRCVQSAIYYLTVTSPFYGSMLQCLTINYSSQVPTAAICWNPKTEQYNILLNAEFFCGFELDQRIAILHHEILHFTNKHLFRMPWIEATPEERKMFNIAGDMAINQYIKHLPPGCVNVVDWKDDKGQPFPVYRSMEEYFELIKNNPTGTKEQMDKYKEFDVHDWEKLTEEEKAKMLDEAKKLVKRTMEKSVYAGSDMPDSIKDLLEELDVLTAQLDYKNILKRVIKKTVSAVDRDSTWNRPNKRYGAFSPGTRVANLPSLNMYIDTSGSISVTEMNQFLDIMHNFLKAGSRKCNLGLWHTDLYYKKPYKLGSKLDPDAVQSGGTDIDDAIIDMNKTRPNLTIILTDGYINDSDQIPKGEIIFIISKGGNANHSLKKYGKTILLDLIK